MHLKLVVYGLVNMSACWLLIRPNGSPAFLARLKSGRFHIGMNTLLTPDEYDYILKDSRARVLIMSEGIWDKIAPICEANPQLKHIIVVGGTPPSTSNSQHLTTYSDWIANQATTCETYSTHREDYATLNYSSGSTGQPEGHFACP